MERAERVEDLNTALLKAMQGNQAGLWTALPCIIKSVNLANQTCEAVPAIQGRVQSRDGNPPFPGATLDVVPWWWVTLPVLVDVPIVFPGGGGYTLTFPVTAGDEALVVFASRCIDAWWQSGGIGVQAEFRMHDLSDGFAFVGVKSAPHAIDSVSSSATQLRSNDGLTYVEVNDGTIKLKAPTSVTINTPLTTVTGKLVVNGDTELDGNLLVKLTATITGLFTYLAGLAGFGGASGSSVITGDLTQTSGNLTSNGTNLHTHIHPQSGGGDTGPPV